MRKAGIVVSVLVCSLAMARGAFADGTIILTSVPQFSSGISNGSITGLDASSGSTDPAYLAARNIYGITESDPYRSASVSTDTTQVGGLVSNSAVSSGASGVSGWCFRYLADPDLTTGALTLKLYVPQASLTPTDSGINDVTVAVLDTHNRAKAWGFDNTLVPDGHPALVTQGVKTLHLSLGQSSGAGGSNFFTQDAGFDLTNAIRIAVLYRGVVGTGFPLTPTGTTGLWLGTQSLTVSVSQTPEPGAWTTLGLGICGTAALRRKRSRGVRR